MATIPKKTTIPERTAAAAPQAASRAAGRTTTARTATAGRTAERGAPSWERVSHRAFEIWQEAGQPDGHDLEHWLQAESELRGR